MELLFNVDLVNELIIEWAIIDIYIYSFCASGGETVEIAKALSESLFAL